MGKFYRSASYSLNFATGSIVLVLFLSLFVVSKVFSIILNKFFINFFSAVNFRIRLREVKVSLLFQSTTAISERELLFFRAKRVRSSMSRRLSWKSCDLFDRLSSGSGTADDRGLPVRAYGGRWWGACADRRVQATVQLVVGGKIALVFYCYLPSTCGKNFWNLFERFKFKILSKTFNYNLLSET